MNITGTNETLLYIQQTIFSAIKFDNAKSDPDRRFVVYNVTIDVPTKIVSDGVWGDLNYGASFKNSTMPLLELQIFTIFIITQCFHTVLKRLGFPYFVSQMMAGFVLGPSLNVEALKKHKNRIFPYGSADILSLLSGIGYAFFLFLNGVQMDFSMITRTGRKVWAIALSSMIIPAVVGLIIIYTLMGHWHNILGEFNGGRLPVVLISHCGCSFPVIASLLSDLKILNSELGRLALSAALVMDIISSILSGLGTAIVSSLSMDSRDHDPNKGPKFALLTVTKYFLFLSIVIFIGHYIMKWMVKRTPEGRPVKKIYTCVVILMALFAGLLGGVAHQPVLGGVLVLGLVVPAGPPLGTELIRQFELFITWFLLPLFVTCCAMKVDLSKHINGNLVLIVVTTIAAVHLFKMLITIGVCRFCKMPTTDGLCLALMLSCKGVVDFCNAVFFFDSMLMSNETMSMMALSILVLGSIARIGTKYLYDPSRKYAGYQKRNILNLKPNSELKIVACIHKPSHIMPMKNTLDIFYPTTTNPIVVHVIHLMELVGRVSPIFISHRLQERVDLNHNYSEDVIVTFNLFEHDNAGSASVSTYTAISPLPFMHDDVCYLALDKLASIIILPFHVRWGEDGLIESKDEKVRTLNSKVLERAPCSVGILVNRGSSNSNTSRKNIAMIFLGGADDREALCIAKRAIKDNDCHLVVYHLVPNHNETNWDVMIDDESLKSVKGYYGHIENVTYEKIIVENPSETTSLISNIANEHDFFIVGRRNGVESAQTAALKNWTEFSELGIIGDLLASSDTKTNASILVVQQQQMPKSQARI